MRTITQTQISAYERCKRCYFLKYVRKLAWPVEVNSRQEIQRGADFHLLVRQMIMGFHPESLLLPAGDEKIAKWVENFGKSMPLKGSGQVFAEKEVSVLYSDVLWLGKFDALALRDDRIVIFDWKTTDHRADAAVYRESPQTRLYRFLAKSGAPRLLGAGLHGIPAENIEDMTWLRLKAREMSSEEESDYPCRENLRACRFCGYETYCFPKQTVFPAKDGSAEEGGPEFPPDDVFQPDFFLADQLSYGDQSEPSF